MASTSDISSNLATRAAQSVSSFHRSTIWRVLIDFYNEETNPSGILSLGIAENALMHSELCAYINEHPPQLTGWHLTYGDGATGTKRLRDAAAAFITRHFKARIPVAREHVVATNGLSTALEHVAFALADRGDGFLLGRPYYGTFPLDFGGRAGVKTVGVAFGPDVDPLSVDGVSCYEDALLEAEKNGTKIRGLVLCHPHNPLGRCYPVETIRALAALCQKYGIHFISDEIYALSVWENNVDGADVASPEAVPFASALSLDLSDIISPSHVHVLWGLSKDFGANGLRVGFIISQANEDFMSAVTAYGLYTYVSSPADIIASRLLEDTEFTDKYISLNQRRLSEAYGYAANFLRKNGIEYKKGPTAAFFLWANLGKAYKDRHGGIVSPDLSKLSLTNGEKKDVEKTEMTLTAYIMEKLLAQKIFIASGENYGAEEHGWFRICFTQPKKIIDDGFARMMKAIES